MGETEGERVFLIRVALGSLREPLKQKDFAKLVSRAAGKRFDPTKISRIESGGQRMSLDDAEAFAAVDPLKRGAPWIAYGVTQPVGETAAMPQHSLERGGGRDVPRKQGKKRRSAGGGGRGRGT
jgi:hypothetical protein